jgi:predicted small secreted protein
MRSLIVILALLVAGCASLGGVGVDYQAYEGKANVYQGEGGTKVTVDDVDLWANGTPPNKFSILGVATVPMGPSEEAVRSAVAGKVKQMGGNAAIQINNNTSFSGVVRSSPSVVLTNEPRQLKFAVVKYA